MSIGAPIGASARLQQDNIRLTQGLQKAVAQLKALANALEVENSNVIYLLRYIVDLQEQYGDGFPFPDLEPRFPGETWQEVLGERE